MNSMIWGHYLLMVDIEENCLPKWACSHVHTHTADPVKSVYTHVLGLLCKPVTPLVTQSLCRRGFLSTVPQLRGLLPQKCCWYQRSLPRCLVWPNLAQLKCEPGITCQLHRQSARHLLTHERHIVFFLQDTKREKHPLSHWGKKIIWN